MNSQNTVSGSKAPYLWGSWFNEIMKISSSRAIVSAISIVLASLLLSSCSGTGSAITPSPSQQVTEPGSPDTVSPTAAPEENEPSPAPAKTTPVKAPTAKPQKPGNTPDESTETQVGQYITYVEFQSSPGIYSGSKIVLFFNASWCSTCRVARDNFESNMNEIPTDLTLVVVDFDDSADLKKKYGVTYQHTFVHINDSGESLHKWSGSVSFSEVVEQIS